MPEQHAVLSASGAARWLNCPPSVKLEQEYGRETASDFAVEGTAAHALAENQLRRYTDEIDEETYQKNLMYIEALYADYVDCNMKDYVDKYCDEVIEQFAKAYAKYKNAAVMFIECRLDFERWVPGGFGTGDVVILTPDYVHVIDLKYGKGVPVSAADNPQLKLYALGAIHNYESVYDFTEVKTTILQPRLDHISEAQYPLQTLLAWAESTVRPAAQLAYEGKGEFKAGEHCRWCKAKAVCRHRNTAALDFIVPYTERNPNTLNEEEISKVYLRMQEIRSYLTDLETYALKAALNGTVFPGLKLVEGRSNRKYGDELKVAEALKKSGMPEERIYERKLLALTALEKALGAKLVSEVIGDLIVKPQGSPVLVSEQDKRPALSSTDSAKEDFKNEIGGN